MESHVEQLRCRYRIFSDPTAAQLLAERLDRVASDALSRRLGDALDTVFAADPAVYVLRRVRSTLALALEPGMPDEAIARSWGEGLAGDVVRAIACDPADGANLVRFADQAEYVAAFLADLLAGRASEGWYFLPFAGLRSRPAAEAAAAVLEENRKHLAPILGRLAGRGLLDDLLVLLGPPAVTALWRRLCGRGEIEPEAWRPLFAAALELAERLGIEVSADHESLFRGFLAGGAPEVDWRDRRALAAGVLEAVRFLLRRSRPALPVNAERRLASAVAALDWLDVPWLEAALGELLGGAAPAAKPGGIARPAGRPTPRQLRLLEALAAVLAGGAVRLDPARPGAPENAVRLYAALIEHAPEWHGNAAATAVIERLLSAWEALLASRTPRQELELRDLSTTLRDLASSAPPRAAEALRFLTGFGDGARQVVTALLDMPSKATPLAAPCVLDAAGYETSWAGLFLLLRAVLDLRLAALSEATAFPGPGGAGHLLAALGLRVVGIDPRPREPLDAGLLRFAGLGEGLSPEELRAVWPSAGAESHLRFQAELLGATAGQRLAQGTSLALYRLAGENGDALVAGIEVAGLEGIGLWPFGRILGDGGEEEIHAAVNAWCAAFEEIFGEPPSTASCDPGLGELPPPPGWPEWKVVDAHHTGRDRLLEALASLEAGRLAAAADLTVALATLTLLRVWARWLRQFASSNPLFLLESFLRRGGRLVDGGEALRLELDPLSMDVVLEMAGYLEAFEIPPSRRITFQLRRT